MKTLEWVLVGACVVELVIHLIWIAKTTRDIKKDEGDEERE